MNQQNAMNNLSDDSEREKQQLQSTSVPPAFLQLCADAERSLRQNAITDWIHIFMLGFTIIAIIALVFRYLKNRIVVHGNLLLLFTNLIIFMFIFSSAYFLGFKIRNIFLLYHYKNPCELLLPNWWVATFLGPMYMYTVGYPLLHFCVMLERLRATLVVDKYEWEGKRLGILMVAVTWSISIGYMAFVIGTSSTDPQWSSHPQALFVLSSQRNADPIFYVQIAMGVLIIITAFCDWCITMMNKRARAYHSYMNYSLSKNYQLNENMLTMRLILPFDVFYAMFFLLFQASAITIRGYRSMLSPMDYHFYYNTIANTLLFFYWILTVFIYLRFLNLLSRCKRLKHLEKRGLSDALEEGAIHFKQLKAQWS